MNPSNVPIRIEEDEGDTVASGVVSVYLRQLDNQLFVADYEVHTAYVRCVLQQVGIRSSQYIEEDLSSVTDLVDDIESLGYDYVLFYVEGNNFRLTNEVSRELLESNEFLHVLWFTTSSQATNWLNESKERVHKVFGLKDILDLVLSPESRKHLNLGKLVQEIPSPYENRLIPIQRVSDVGLISSIPLDLYSKEILPHTKICDEVHFLAQSLRSGSAVILPFRDENFLAALGSLDLIEQIGQTSDRFKYALRVHLESLGDATLKEMKAYNVCSCDIRVSDLPSAMANSLKLLSDLESVQDSIDVSFEVCVTKERLSLAVDLMDLLKHHLITVDIRFVNGDLDLGEIIPSDIAGCLLGIDVVEDSSGALRNGFMSFVTGFYPHGVLNTFAKHVGLQERSLDGMDFAALKQHMNINSAIIVKREPRLGKLNPALSWSSTSKRPRIDNGLFSERQSDFVPLVHQVYRIDQESYLQLGDVFSPTRIEELPYSRTAVVQLDEMSFLKLETQKDLRLFLDDVDYFISNGYFTREYQVSSMLFDSCRWGAQGECRLNQLPRFNIAHDGMILPCGSCSRAIGTVDDAHSTLIQNTYVISEIEQTSRCCTTCEVGSVCSKCTMLPDFMSSKEYCDIRKRRIYIDYYLVVSNVIRLLRRHSQFFKAIPISEIAVSLPASPRFYTGTIGENARKRLPATLLFVVTGQAVIFNAISQRLLKLSEPMAFVFEALAFNVNDTDISKELSNKFMLDTKSASEFVSQAIHKLQPQLSR